MKILYKEIDNFLYPIEVTKSIYKVNKIKKRLKRKDPHVILITKTIKFIETF